MLKKIPHYLTGKNELIGTIVFTVLFAIVYLNIYSPESNTTWFELDRSIYFFVTLGFITLATLILVVSRIIMYRTRNAIKLNYLEYVLWALGEVAVISLFYTYITYYLLELDEAAIWIIFRKALLTVSIVLLVPYTIAAIYCIFNARKRAVQLFNYDNVVTDEDEHPQKLELVHLSDNNGNLKLSVKLDNLYYIESQDNYIKIFYLNNGVMKNYMLRCKLKTVEENFAGSPLVRCHRSYIVNIDKIRVIRKERDGMFIDIDFDGTPPIPVSKGYVDRLKL